MSGDRAAELIRELGLAPHPEGGAYAEVFRSAAPVTPADGRGARAALTVIWFLLRAGECSRWHAVRSDEQWTFVDGDPLTLYVAAPDGPARTVRLGPLDGECTPTVVVPAGAWQAARTAGAYTLVTCTVGPGFDFADFRLLADHPAEAAAVRAAAPALADLL